jgi:hypothetical protein
MSSGPHPLANDRLTVRTVDSLNSKLKMFCRNVEPSCPAEEFSDANLVLYQSGLKIQNHVQHRTEFYKDS